MLQSHHKPEISIWFFIGGLLGIYGLLILGTGIAEYGSPQLSAEIAMPGLHLQLWWGALLIVLGVFYVVRFWPGRRRE